MEYAILKQGRFTSAGSAKTLRLNPQVDIIEVYNYSRANVASGMGGSVGTRFFWQNGMNQNDGFVSQRNAGGTADLLLTSAILGVGGFTVIDSTISTPGATRALTAAGITAANPPVATTSAVPPSVGDIVRFDSLNNQPQIGGIDFTVTAVVPGAPSTFTIGNISLVNSVASTAGNFRIIPFDPIFYPRARTITYISSTAQAKVYMSVTHGYTVGQSIRLSFPGGSQVWGQWAQLNGVQALIVAVNAARAGNEPNNGGTANSITINVDTSAFVAWNTFGNNPNNNLGTQSYVSSNQVPYSPAQVIPVGEGANNDIVTVPQYNANLLDDATRNEGFKGVILAAGANSPAGQAGDVIFWKAGQSYNVNNE